MRALPVLSRAFGLIASAAALVAAAKTAWMRRRLVAQMTGFDDHMLRDIGLTRTDLDAALSVAGFDDPTQRLALRAREARSNRRAAALEQQRWIAMVGDAEAASGAETARRAA